MNLMKWAKKTIKKLDVMDIAALKTCCLFIGMILGAYISAFVKQYIWIFAVVAILLWAWLAFKVFGK